MIGDRISIDNLKLIYNSNLNKKCVDSIGEIRRELLQLLFTNRRIIGIFAESKLYTSAVELYKVEGYEAVAFAYLHLRVRDNNKVFYSISIDLNKVGTSFMEFEFTDCKKAANIIMKQILEKFNL